MRLTSDGFFTHLWTTNRRGEKVYPCVITPQDGSQGGIFITRTTSRDDYESVELDELIELLAGGAFEQSGRIRMKPRTGGVSASGFAIRDLQRSSELEEEIARRRRR
jgi:hypothetical protein